MNETVAVCPGSFDPVTVGHLDIFKRASGMFGKVIVVVMENDAKHPVFSADERRRMLETVIAETGISNIEVDTSDALLADYCREKNAVAIVKGLRALTDFEYEFQMALTNKKLNPEADTVFLTTSAENMYLSSSLVRLVAMRGGDITGFVPASIQDYIKSKLYRKG